MKVEIKPLSPDLLEDYLEFFDTRAFADNPDWSGCYCCFYHFGGNDQEWMKRTVEQNREEAKAFILEGKLKGWLAYSEGRVVGWCNVNEKGNFQRLSAKKELCLEDDDKTCSIVCYIISPEFRRKGIASEILEQVCKDCAQKGFSYLEAYPCKGELTSAQQYHGPMAMYARAGFKIVKAFDGFDIIRKKLNGGIVTLDTKEFRALVDSFYKAMGNILENTASIKLSDDKWSLKEIIGHLIDSASNNHQRFVRLQTGDLLDFPAYDGENWIKIENYNGMSWSNITALWYNYNLLLLNVLENVNEDSLKNVWVKDEEAIPLNELINHYYGHIRAHIKHFEDRLAEVGGKL